MSSIKRDQSWRGSVEFLYSLQMTHTHTHTPTRCVKRASRDVGRGLKHFGGLSREVEECLVRFVNMLQASSIGVFCDPQMSKISEPCVLFLFFCSFQLKHHIMNSLVQREAIRRECTFKFEQITNKLRPHSREL